MKTISLYLIKFYRKALSPFLGHHCRFYPTCSEYAEIALQKKGFWRGSAKTLARIAKCHPFHPGGFDPVE